jgi:hypothetical protein
MTASMHWMVTDSSRSVPRTRAYYWYAPLANEPSRRRTIASPSRWRNISAGVSPASPG